MRIINWIYLLVISFRIVIIFPNAWGKDGSYVFYFHSILLWGDMYVLPMQSETQRIIKIDQKIQIIEVETIII